MTSDETTGPESGRRNRDGGSLDRVNRRAVLRASAATGAAGLLAGCPSGGSVLPGGDQSHAAGGECPEIARVEDGFIWVQKRAAAPWKTHLSIGSDGSGKYATGGDAKEIRGNANIGQGQVEFDEPGEYRFLYRIDSGDLTWVEPLDSLMAVVFRDEPYARYGLVTGDDVLDYSVYPYTPDEPLSMSFEIPEPGTYRIAYGPANGAFLFEEWLPDLRERSTHMHLGVAIDGDESAYSWVYPEMPEHVSVWFGETETLVCREPHAPDVECEFDLEDHR